MQARSTQNAKLKFEPFDYDRKNKLDVRTNDVIYNWFDHDRKNKLDARANQAKSWHEKPWLNVLSNDRKKIFIQLWWDKTENNQNPKIFVIKTARTLRQITKTLQKFYKTLNPHLKTKNM